METVNEFLKDLRSRLTSPFFGSFLISWVIINWRIPVALLFYKQDDLHLDGYNSYIDVISSNYDNWNFFGWPIASAFGYTFIYPFFRDFIRKIHARIAKVTDAKLLKISKDGYISVSKHMELQQKYEDNIQKITKFFENQDKLQQDYATSLTDLGLAKQKAAQVKAESDSRFFKWESMLSKNMFEGRWKVDQAINGTIVERSWSISNSVISIYNPTTGVEKYYIKSINANPSENLIVLTLNYLRGEEPEDYYYDSFILEYPSLTGRSLKTGQSIDFKKES